MNTPICDFIDCYAQGNALRFHMPGHKGQGSVEKLDITEVAGADVLYHGEGIIRESQENAAKLFGTAKTLYSAEGSSLAIRAMLYLTRLYAGKRPVIAAGRNAHKSFVTAAALLDADVRWIFPRESHDAVSCRITPGELDAFLNQAQADAVYITSPDYLGNVADVAELAKVCKKHGALLLVDNAHGAYLRFLTRSLHPMDLGADMCCDSAHKTLPVLTGGAYLHISDHPLLLEQGEAAMSLFASTSPSYLILRSLDSANRYLNVGYREKLEKFIPHVAALKEKLLAAGYELAGMEPLKITLAPKSYGYLGTELADILLDRNMVCEFCDPDYLVLMVTPETGTDALKQLETVLLSVTRKEPISRRMPPMGKPVRAMSLHEAVLTPGRNLPIRDCLGKILASPTVSCPPAIPILVCGERIDRQAIAVMEYYGIETLNVL